MTFSKYKTNIIIATFFVLLLAGAGLLRFYVYHKGHDDKKAAPEQPSSSYIKEDGSGVRYKVRVTQVCTTNARHENRFQTEFLNDFERLKREKCERNIYLTLEDKHVLFLNVNEFFMRILELKLEQVTEALKGDQTRIDCVLKKAGEIKKYYEMMGVLKV